MTDQQRATTARRDLARRHPAFEQVSPDVGVLDDDALRSLAADEPDEALALLADLANATDRSLADAARHLAARLSLDVAARAGSGRRGPAARLRVRRLPETGGDLDLDASLDAIAAARAGGAVPSVDELRAQVWDRPGRALCLLLDRSGSMRGGALAAAALAAAAVAWRAPDDHSVVAFADDAVVVKAQDAPASPETTVERVLGLRGHGTTDLALALRAAGRQLDRSAARDRLVLVLSDCRATAGDDPTVAARELGDSTRVAVVAPGADADDARAFAAAVGAVLATVEGPASIPAAFAHLLP